MKSETCIHKRKRWWMQNCKNSFMFLFMICLKDKLFKVITVTALDDYNLKIVKIILAIS